MHASIRYSILAAVTLALVACDRSTVEPSAPQAVAAPLALTAQSGDASQQSLGRDTDVFEWYYNRIVTFGCGPLDEGSTELVSVEGVGIVRDASLQLPDGTYQGRVQVHPTKLAGVGTRTGHAYEVTTQGGNWDVYADDFAKGTQREVWSMRNLVTGEKYAFTYLVRWEFDADRNLVEHREEEKVRCQ